MPEYDAFGREIGEDTLSGLGGSGTEQPQPRAEPAPAPRSEGFTEARPAEPAQATSSVPEAPVTVLPGGRRRRVGGLGCVIALAILAAAVAGPVIAIVGFVGDASDVIDDVTDAFDPETFDPPGADPPDVPAPPTGLEGKSLIAADNLRGALRQIEQDGFTRLTRIVVRPDRLGAGVVKGGRERDVDITSQGELARGTARPANAASPTIPLASVDPAAPTRLVRGSARRYRVKPRGIDYLVLSTNGSGGHQWVAYFKNGLYVLGDAEGRVVRKIS